MQQPGFVKELEGMDSIIDFIRFGLSKAREAGLYYGHGTDNPQDDIHALILQLLSLPWEIEPHFLQARLSQNEKKLLTKGLEQRIIQRIPVPYITHQAHFCGLDFYVDSRVLIPRSPFAELILQQFSPWVQPDRVTRILDMCTGSACIAIACCHAFPEAAVDAVDYSSEALKVAEINQERHHLQDQLELIQSDLFNEMPERLYDIIVSNPPYVSAADCQALPAEYQHEPRFALEAEDNGLALVRRLLNDSLLYLKPDGILIVEVGLSQEALIDAYPDLPFVWLEFEQGGEGVFLLTAEQLKEYSHGQTI